MRLALAALAMLVGLGLADPRPARAGPRAQATTAPIITSQVNGPFAGIWSDVYAERTLDELQAAWTRATVRWSVVEPSNNSYNWEALDAVMVGASGGGRRNVQAVVSSNPGWAAASRCTITTQDERNRLAEFMTALVSRYRDRVPDGPLAGRPTNVKYWSLYNEADNTSREYDAQNDLGGCFATLSGTTATPEGREHYARMIETVGAAVHSADRDAKVVSSAVGSGNFTDIPNCDVVRTCRVDRDFLEGVVATLRSRGALGQLDAVAVNYFSSQGRAFGYEPYGVDLIGRVSRLRQDQLDAGLAPGELKPIIVQEGSYTGEASNVGGESTDSPSHPFNVAQRNYVTKALARAAYMDVLAYYWFWLRDTSGGLGGDNAYGLLDRDGDPKPSYQAFKYFSELVDRQDRFVGRLSFASPKLEGYELTTDDGRRVQIVWNQTDTESVAYTPGADVTSVTDPVGGALSSDDTVAVGADPRFIFLGSGTGSPSSSGNPSTSSIAPGVPAPSAPAVTSDPLTQTPPPAGLPSGVVVPSTQPAPAAPPPAQPAAPPPPTTAAAPRDQRFFSNTGFRIDNDRFWEYFNRRGGVRTFGYPISREFTFLGFRAQFFQGQIMQLRPDGSVALMNLLQEGLMPATRVNGSIFPAEDPALTGSSPRVDDPAYGERIVEFMRRHAPNELQGRPVRFFDTFLGTVDLATAFPGGGGDPALLPLINLEIWGAVTSPPMVDPNNADFVYQRYQRSIMHYRDSCRCTERILLADWFKTVITGQGLPPDLAEDMANSRFIRQYDNAQSNGLARPSQLPETDLRSAFEPQ